jgi:chromate transporter
MTAESTASSRLLEVAGLFLRLGSTAFGGPAVHTALMHDEVVKRRGWLSDEEFLDLLGATNLIPGPNSTEMAIHIGYLRAGWPGLILGGACFILPSMLIVMVLAWIYSRYGQTPEAGWILYGIKPVVIAIILKALWELGRKALRSPTTGLTGLGALALNLFGINELILLFGGGLAVMLARVAAKLTRKDGLAALLPLAGLGAPGLAALSTLAASAAAAPFGLGVLFLTFLKIGAVLYGSGYVLLAFLRADFVLRLGWLTDQQIIDAVAIGQFTPGPLSTTATFIGYQLGGVPGALLATLGIFLPGFIFVALTNPIIPRLRSSPWLGGFLDGVNAASLGLMAAVTARLGQAALVDGLSIALGVVSAVLLLRVKINPTWLIAGGAIAGLMRWLIT